MPLARVHHGAPGVVDVHLVHLLERGAHDDIEDVGELPVGDRGGEHRLRVVDGMPLLGEEPVQRARERRLVPDRIHDVRGQGVDGVDGRPAVSGAHPPQLDDLRAHGDPQGGRGVLVRGDLAGTQHLLARGHPRALDVLRVAEVGVERVVQVGPACHERPGALAADDVAVFDEPPDRLADRHTADAEALRQLVLVGQLDPERELTGDDRAAQLVAHHVGQERAGSDPGHLDDLLVRDTSIVPRTRDRRSPSAPGCARSLMLDARVSCD